MKAPAVIQANIVILLHGELLARFGGIAGIQCETRLDSSLSNSCQMPESVFKQASIYAARLVKNHPFVDGNKRIGFMAAYIVLGINGYRLQAPEEEAVIMTRDLASGETNEKAYAEWLEKSCVKR